MAYGFGFGGGRNAEKETRIRPIVDVARVALAGMLLAAWNVFWITYTVRKAARSRS